MQAVLGEYMDLSPLTQRYCVILQRSDLFAVRPTLIDYAELC